jgi:ABC-2 type transport system ATP-binding protein
MINKVALEVQDIHVYYGSQHAVDGVSFAIESGEIFGLLGPNGAGKTSTLSVIEGLVQPRSGKVMVAGYDITEHPAHAKANMGVQLQSTSFQSELTVYEIIALYGGLYGVNATKQKVDELLREIGLESDGSKRFGQLSGGQQQRVSLIIATLHSPELILLDEPTSGLDPQSRRQLWDRIENLKNTGRSILLTTHSMEEAEAVCDRIAIIDHGRILVINTPQKLIEEYEKDPRVVAVSRGLRVTLEDVFIGLTGKALRA